ncbi:MAG: peptide chain release factor N(5)-glutamine methyltransferase [Chroococcidiopsidaceae cyanobacterium CP_BM_RX_35]|nr:peptide chain release factor N(5)-glutamine methyltransferase [Chroococcidiopsidaceae cyanobacterium CP_BM_RX_35]
MVSGHNLWQWRAAAQSAAIAADVPITEVDWLLQELAGLDRLVLRLETFKSCSCIKLRLPLKELEQLWQRRLKDRLPVQYIAGVTPWRRLKVAVSPGVLIPRPETEFLIDLALKAVQSSSATHLSRGHWADLGTGSGVIALSLADAFKAATIHAVDLSVTALSIAQYNALTLGFADRIHFYQGNWWEPLELLKGQFSGLVANPPYIPTLEVQHLQPEVALHEPHLALDGGWDGLDCIRQLVETSPTYLCSGGVFLIEIMVGQAEQVAALLHSQGSYHNIEIHTDLAGIERYALAYRY